MKEAPFSLTEKLKAPRGRTALAAGIGLLAMLLIFLSELFPSQPKAAVSADRSQDTSAYQRQLEQRLEKLPRFRGRRNFTVAHEIAHQILYRLFPDAYGMQRRTLCDYRRSSKPCKQITDWTEWQADTLGAAILLPEDAVQEGMFIFGLGEHMKVLSKKYSPNKFESFCRMADFLGVSRTTLSYRMEQLGLLERNLLCVG